MTDKLEERLKDIQTHFLTKTSKLVNEGKLTDEEAGEINSLAEDGHISKAKTKLEEYRDDDILEFDDEEKQVFAESFSEDFDNLLDEISKIRTILGSLEDGASRGDLKDYLRGQKSSRTKKEVEAVFDAVDSFNKGEISDKKIAKVLTAFGSGLTIKKTRKMVSEIRAKTGEVN